MESLEARVERLERSNRRLKRGAGLLAVAGLAILLMGQGEERPRALTATSVALLDEAGEVRGAFGLAEGKPLLFLSSPKGASKVVMCVEDDDHAFIELSNTGFGGALRLALTGSTSFLRFSQGGKPTLMLFSNAILDPRIVVARRNGDFLWKSPFNEP